jgi:hypothetical protein
MKKYELFVFDKQKMVYQHELNKEKMVRIVLYGWNKKPLPYTMLVPVSTIASIVVQLDSDGFGDSSLETQSGTETKDTRND